ncbi:hypothetical protein DFH07DRAFT_862614 [Mycena maculata]|uniref:Uncharacterized protein n=1 Tax=Mycena maculata TaxID=230809 RepID=A0AAD7HAB7_9AGAR|nr:hypothetical protein DFH07DRAFT_862614 [Mycena maculata]
MPEPDRRPRIQMAGYVLLRPQIRVRVLKSSWRKRGCGFKPTGDSRTCSVHCTGPLTEGTRILGSIYGVPEKESQEQKTHPRQSVHKRRYSGQSESVLLSPSPSLSVYSTFIRAFDNSSSAIGVSPCPRPTRGYSGGTRSLLSDPHLLSTSSFRTHRPSAPSKNSRPISLRHAPAPRIPTASVSHTNPGVPLRTLCGIARTRTHPWGRISVYPAADRDRGLPFVRTRNSEFK